MNQPLWTFEGYKTEAGSKVVQDWYWDDLTIDEREMIRDRVGILEHLHGHLWRAPYYENLGDIGEIRKKKTTRGALRIYGCRESNRFIMLHGVLKKVNNDKNGKDKAKSRYKLYKSGKGSSDGFNFKEKSDRSNST